MLAVIAMSVGLIGYSGPSAPRFEPCDTVRRDGASALGDSACRALLQLVRAVQETDYKGDLDSLRRLHAAMAPFVYNAELAKHARYWRGFALWRRALNPRFVFVAAPQRFHAPPEVGGSRTEAIAMVEAALARLAPSRADTIEAALEPTWGGPELHMLLATLLVRSRTQLDKAQRHAERALELRPNWLAVRRNLIPSIRELRTEPPT